MGWRYLAGFGLRGIKDYNDLPVVLGLVLGS
jgi:hypothetical protein